MNSNVAEPTPDMTTAPLQPPPHSWQHDGETYRARGLVGNAPLGFQNSAQMPFALPDQHLNLAAPRPQLAFPPPAIQQQHYPPSYPPPPQLVPLVGLPLPMAQEPHSYDRASRWPGLTLDLQRPQMPYRHSASLSGHSNWSPIPSPTVSIAESSHSFFTEDDGEQELQAGLMSDSYTGTGILPSPTAMHISMDQLRSPLSASPLVSPLHSPTLLHGALPLKQSASSDFESTASASTSRRRAPVRKGSRSAVLVQGSTVRKRAQGSKRKVITLEVPCRQCDLHFVTVNLRGAANDLDVDFEPQYTCIDCSPIEESPVESVLMSKKRSHTSRETGSLATCDVCFKNVGKGGIVAVNPKTELNFGLEIICISCSYKYQRCSDCGGGGGPRLGTGKWRAREVFISNRKTCRLNHMRTGPAPEPDVIAGHVTELPANERATLVNECRAVWENTMLSALAIPEVLEADVVEGLSEYNDVIDLMERGWNRFSPTLGAPAPADLHIERYVGVRRVKPNVRKKATATVKDYSSDHGEQDPPGSWLSQSKNLSGFAICEWDKPNGTCFFSVVCPWGSGDTYEAQADIIAALGNRVMNDREGEIDTLLATGYTSSEAHHYCPPVRHFWTMVFYKRDSRIVKFLEKRRGFLLLDDYLAKHKDAMPEWFPPYRQTPQLTDTATSWLVLVKDHLEGVEQPSQVVLQSLRASGAVAPA